MTSSIVTAVLPLRNTSQMAEKIASMPQQADQGSRLPRLILQNVPYRITCRETEPRVSRDIGLAFRDSNTLSRAARQFIQVLQQRTV